MPQNPPLQSLGFMHAEPIAPSLQRPSAVGSELFANTQILLVQSLACRQEVPLLPSLQLPTNDAAGSTHGMPFTQSLASLHVAPDAPLWQRRSPSHC